MSQRLQLLQKLLEESPNDSFTLFAIAKEYEGLGETQEALQHYQHLRSNNPDYVGLYYHLGKLLEKESKVREAIEAYDTGIAVAKKLGDTHSLSELNVARMELDDSDEDDI